MDPQTKGELGITIGIILIIATLFAYYYRETVYVDIGTFWKVEKTEYPYKPYSFPTALAGIISIIYGIAELSTHKKPEKQPEKYVEARLT